MKTSLKILTLAGVLCAGLLTLHAADQKVLAGPKGGRLLEKTEPKAEFYLEKDHTATITFYDAALKPVPVAGQSVTVIADAKGRQSHGRVREERRRAGKQNQVARRRRLQPRGAV
jgi:hypothetical protein